MFRSADRVIGTRLVVAALLAIFTTACSAPAVSAADASRNDGSAVFTVDGRVALAAFMSLSDAHLQKVADSLTALAATPEARRADWEGIKGALGEVAWHNIPSVTWFALPDGTYWTVEQGRIEQKLVDRPYFGRLLAGQTVIGDLVVSKSSGKSVGIVAVPIMRDGSMVGALGSSIYLDKMSELITKEMALDRAMIFYSFDSRPMLALVWDPQLIFLEPMKEESPSLKRAFSEMLTRDEGQVEYEFRGTPRTVIYRKSPVTKWWYAFGMVGGGHAVQ